MVTKPKILVVEDEEAIRRGLIDLLVYHGFDVDALSTGGRVLQTVKQAKYDLVILDVMLPEKDGFTVCDELRSYDREQPIIMLTAKTADEDIVTGLRLGADDYIGKPFSLEELLLRIQAVLRRSHRLQRTREQIELADGRIKIDTRTLNGMVASKEMVFTRREIEILEYLSEHQGYPVSRGELLERVWEYRGKACLDTRTVDIHIAKLRRKIERNSKEPEILVTVRGEGYQLLIDSTKDGKR
jgi:DNA-binding response OmpR family regulator